MLIFSSTGCQQRSFSESDSTLGSATERQPERVDREAGTVSVVFDFDRIMTEQIPEELKNVSLNAFDVLNIGQDGTGAYSDPLPAVIDEVILFDGAFTQDDISALAAYYKNK